MTPFRKKVMAAICAAVIAVFLVTSTPAPRQANAAGTAILMAAWQMGQQMLTQFITNAITQQLASSLSGTILENFLPQMQDMWQRFARERLMAEIANMEQKGQIEQAAVNQEYVNAVEEQRLENLKENQISDGMCQLVSGEVIRNSYNNAAGVRTPVSGASVFGSPSSPSPRINALSTNGTYEEKLTEMVRRDMGNTADSLCSKGTTECNMVLLEERLSKFCSPDEHNGNLTSCTNSDDSRVNLDTDASMLTGCYTIRKQDTDALIQLIRYLIPKNNPLPQTVVSDPEMQRINLERAMQTASQNSQISFILKQAARHLEPETCPGIAGITAKTFVEAIEDRIGPQTQNYRNIPGADRPCPSLAEMECFNYSLQFEDPLFVESCSNDEGCALKLETYNLKAVHETKTLEEQMNLSGASSKGI